MAADRFIRVAEGSAAPEVEEMVRWRKKTTVSIPIHLIQGHSDAIGVVEAC